MRFMDRAWALQHRLDARIKKLPSLSLEFYLKFVSLLFFLTGFMFLIFFYIGGFNPFDAAVMSCPFFYLVTGMVMFCLFLLVRFT